MLANSLTFLSETIINNLFSIVQEISNVGIRGKIEKLAAQINGDKVYVQVKMNRRQTTGTVLSGLTQLFPLRFEQGSVWIFSGFHE